MSWAISLVWSAIDLLRIGAVAHVDSAHAQRRNVLPGRCLILPDVQRGLEYERGGCSGKGAIQQDEPIGFRIRGRLQQNALTTENTVVSALMPTVRRQSPPRHERSRAMRPNRETQIVHVTSRGVNILMHDPFG